MSEEEYLRLKNLMNAVIEQQATFAEQQATLAEQQARFAEQQSIMAESQRRGEERQRRNEEGIAALLTIAEIHEQEVNRMNERMDARFAETDERINALVNVVKRYISKN